MPYNKSNYSTDAASDVIAGMVPGRQVHQWAPEAGTRNIYFDFRESMAPFTNPPGTTGFSQFNAQQIAATRLAFQAWQDVANVNFVENSPGNYSNSGWILLGNFLDDAQDRPAFAYLPDDTVEARFDVNSAGDVWVDANYSANFELGLGQYGRQTLVHEIGHALGLQHPGNYDSGDDIEDTYLNGAPYYEDTQQYTNMSYFDASWTGGQFWVDADGDGEQTSGEASYYSASPMMDDIAAIQKIYGARAALTGSTTYGFGSNTGRDWYTATSSASALIFCAYDTGGVDTFNFSGYSYDQRIDLNAAFSNNAFRRHFSDVGGMKNNVSIYVGVVIENAVGGAGDDTIIGNTAANILTGNGGSDRLEGFDSRDAATASGVDTLIGGDGGDVYVLRSASTVIQETGASGFDTIESYIAINGDYAGIETIKLMGGVTTSSGGAGANGFVGGDAGDSLSGNGGNDTLDGAGGVDTLDGGADNDLIRGGAAGDTLTGGLGNDTIYGFIDDAQAATADGADSIDGGAGDDKLFGELGDDTLVAGSGLDTLDGGSGNDSLTGGDAPSGTLGYDDRMYGWSGVDIIRGGAGNDEIFGDGKIGEDAALPGGDSLYGEDGNDVIYAGAGNDSVEGGAGNDALEGFEDEDTIHGQAGADTIEGGEGKDSLFGAEGFDIIKGDEGNDTIDGGADNDSIVGGSIVPSSDPENLDADSLLGNSGADTIFGGIGKDFIDGGIDNDVLNGGLGDDTIFGGSNDVDVIRGDEGDDSLDGGSGDDYVQGGADDDTLIGGVGADGLLGDAGNDSLDGGDGLDTLYGGAGGDTYVFRGHEDIQETIAGAAGGRDTIEGYVGLAATGAYNNIEVFRLMSADAVVAYANGGDNDVYGNVGNDLLFGLSGADLLEGNSGADTLDGGAGADTLYGGTGIDVYKYDGADVISDMGSDAGDRVETTVSASLASFVGIENMTAIGTAEVSLTGNDGANTLIGNTRANQIFALGGADSVEGGRGNDFMSGGAGADTMKGGDDNDSMLGGEGALDLGDLIDGEAGNDTARGWDGADTISGSAGLDSLSGDAGADSLLGGADADMLDGGADHDTLLGGTGDDTLVSASGRDAVAGEAGTDVLRADFTRANYSIKDFDFGADALGGFMGAFAYATNRDDGATQLVGFSGVERFDLTGGSVDDTLRSADGDDTLRGLAGNDHLVSGKGVDVIDGGDGGADRWEADKFFADETQRISINLTLDGVQSTYLGTGAVRGIEALTLQTGDAGDSVVTRGDFLADSVTTNEGDDAVKVAGGRDTVSMGDGNDRLIVDWSSVQTYAFKDYDFGPAVGGGYSGVYAYATNRDDGVTNLVAFSGVERFDITGGAGGDIWRTGDGADYVRGMAGNDHLITGKGADTIDGGANEAGKADRWQADKSAATTAIVLDLTAAGVQSTYAIDGVSATVRGIEALGTEGGPRFVTGSGADVITTRSEAFRDFVTTGAGDDLVKVAGGRDAADLGAGTDTLVVDWSGVETYAFKDYGFGGSLAAGYSGVFAYAVNRDDGATNLIDFAGVEKFDVTGGAGGDIWRTGDGADVVRGMAGNDDLITGKGIDTIDGGAGIDRWLADKSAATAAIVLDLTAADVQSTYVIEAATATVAGIEELGWDAATRFVTGSGNDVLTTRTDRLDDFVATGSGDDLVKVAGGRDAADLGTGTDTLVVDWSSVQTYAFKDYGFGGSLAAGYSGVFAYAVNRDDGNTNLINFAGVEKFDVTGGAGGDVWRTGDGADVVRGMAGNDHLVTAKGVDTIDGGANDAGQADRWEADKSAATAAIVLDLTAVGVQSTYAIGSTSATVSGIEVLGTDGGARFVTGSGADIITTRGERFHDFVATGSGADLVKVAGGRDAADLGAGTDTLVVDWSAVETYAFKDYDFAGSLAAGYSGVFAYAVNRDDGNTNLINFAGVEKFDVTGGAGGDIWRTGDGADIVRGMDGNDHLITAKGVDVIDGGDGTDRWEADKSFAGASDKIAINLTATGAQSTYLGTGTVRGIEALSLQTGAAGDSIVTRGEFLGDVVTTNGGDDAVKVAGGRDVVSMGQGNDRLIIDWSAVTTYQFGTFDFDGGLADGYSGAYAYGSNRDDGATNLVDFSGVERFDVTSGAGNDFWRTGDGADYLRGMDGADHLVTAKGLDTIDGGLGNDRWEADKSAATAAITLDLTLAGVQSSYAIGSAGATVRGIEALGTTGDARFVTGSGADAITTRGDFLGDFVATGAGNDLVKVSGGRDAVDLGAGIDTLVVDWSSIGNYHFGVFDFAGNLAAGYSGAYAYGSNRDDGATNLVAFAGVEKFDVTGGAGGDSFVTGDGADTLNGGLGADRLEGRGGSDLYLVDNVGDVVVEAVDGGVADTVRATLSWTLADNVERLVLLGAATDGTGNALANQLTGNDLNNRLDGLAGADTMSGGKSSDAYVVDSSGDRVIEAAGGGTADKVEASVTHALAAEVERLTLTGSAAIDGTGNALANVMIGNGAANTLNGLGGADSMTGGLGNDIYVVDSKLDRVTEAAGGGTDTVQSSVTLTLAANVERLTLTGSAAIDGAGNALANAITGNAAANKLNGLAGADTMTGGAGNDTYVVDTSADRVVEGADGGTDTVLSSVTHTLAANVENLMLGGSSALGGAGNALGNVLTGNSAANKLNGLAGADTMIGGAGDDTYVVDDAGDRITEAAAGGADTVLSAVSITLSANVENLTLGGSASTFGFGNASANAILGNSGSNTLTGGLGRDTMTGGAGADAFLFRDPLEPTNVDVVTDFTAVDDTIRLDDIVFAGLATGGLAASAFVVGAAAADASDRIVYDAGTGKLWFDGDGTGAAAAIQFATLKTGLALTNADFLVV